MPLYSVRHLPGCYWSGTATPKQIGLGVTTRKERSHATGKKRLLTTVGEWDLSKIAWAVSLGLGSSIADKLMTRAGAI